METQERSIPFVKGWKENQPISNVSAPSITPESSTSPCVVQLPGGNVYAFFKGGSTNFIYYVEMDADGNWSGNQRVEVDGEAFETDRSPVAAVFQGQIYLVWRKKSNKRVAVARFDGTAWTWGKSIKTLSDGDINPESGANPAVTAFQKKLYIAYQGSGGSRMYLCWYDGKEWDGNKKMESDGDQLRCDKGPALAVYQDNLYCCWQGNGSQKIYQATWNGNGNPAKDWENYKTVELSRSIKNQPRTNKFPTLVPFSDRLYLWYKGNHSDRIYQVFLKDQVWKENLPVGVVSDKDIESDAAVGAGIYQPPRGKEQVIMVYKNKKNNDLFEAKYY